MYEWRTIRSVAIRRAPQCAPRLLETKSFDRLPALFFEIRGDVTDMETFAGWYDSETRNFARTKLPASGIMPVSRPKKQKFAVCLRNTGYGASLEVRKLYAFLDDPDADANNLIRVIDESGEDYVYPARMFQKLVLPAEIERALRLAS